MDKSRVNHVVSKSSVNRLVIIDGNAVMHRAFHALPPLTDPQGNIINAIYGFVSMTLKIYEDMKPTHMAVVFDRPAPTFRKKMFKDYQIKRPKMDENLIPQIDRIHEVVSSMGLPIFEMDGYEADDLIGTIVNQVVSDKHMKKEQRDEHMKNKSSANHVISSSVNHIEQVIIVTGDRDIFQLVEEGKVFVYMPTKGLSEAKLYGEKEVLERMGVLPNQIPDFKALAGDSSDNYPGVEGIGPKTAIELLNIFRSVNNLYQFLDANQVKSNDQHMIKKQHDEYMITEKIKEKLIKGKESSLLSYQLACIKKDVPVEIELPEIQTLNTERAREEFQKLGFKTLFKRLTGEEVKAEKKAAEVKNKKEPEDTDSGQQSLF